MGFTFVFLQRENGNNHEMKVALVVEISVPTETPSNRINMRM